MAISFDKAFGIHPQGLQVRAQRAELIASNIANADTPGYKAKGMDFKAALAQAASKQQTGMTRTNEKHFDVRMELNNGVGFRIPDQADTGDGNSVDVQVERNLYLENSMEYQASLQFLTSKIKGLKQAITGGQ
ncbi:MULTISPECIES: flagellar basal body rod protein FlgB [unclassified Colwellia]|uniref:flagellar basal body rod protein FlgB n=1 Tax=unclassified Colwellia TaxID=196834 RepID=UPI0015F725F7|nr:MULTISPECIES: flagellar basal body rod protein FlgB [unclassified Colwellia]MBA6290037.1 flagellar basal body rod protein FlgB [Colwellia sp. MB3u-4]MBA6296915.1 flagellar basal body rod protein FlgB [Colwellia sp. MB02u-9]